MADLAQRVRVDPTDPVHGCWHWLGTLTTQGYGQIQQAGRKMQAHRLVFELVVGPIPRRMQLDHLCRNRDCVNPRHLEPVTNRENIMRGIVPSANRMSCKAGRHDITLSDSIYVDSDGVERCRECRRESKRRYAERRRLAFV